MHPRKRRQLLILKHQLWDRGPDILALQQWLNANGYPLAQSGVGSPGQETDIFGPHTYRALLKFQAAHDLPQTGYFGPLTRAAIATIGGSSTSGVTGTDFRKHRLAAMSNTQTSSLVERLRVDRPTTRGRREEWRRSTIRSASPGYRGMSSRD